MRRHRCTALAAVVVLFALAAMLAPAERPLAVAATATASGPTPVPAYAADVRGGRWERYIASAGQCPGASTRNGTVRQQERAMRCLINQARERRGLDPVKTNSRLNRAADYKNRAMLRCDDFAHEPCGNAFVSVFKRSGYVRPQRAWSVGENIAWGTGELGTPQAVLKAWLESSGHRLNLFASKWHEQGVSLMVARFQGHQDAAVWASAFGYRR